MSTGEAIWSAGEQIAGSNNWVMSGSTNIPTQWTGTLSGSDPLFTNAAGGDYSMQAEARSPTPAA